MQTETDEIDVGELQDQVEAYEPHPDSHQYELYDAGGAAPAHKHGLSCTLQDVYMHGCCYLLAAALHLKFGLRLCYCIYGSNGDGPGLYHAWVRYPRPGLYIRDLDIRGLLTPKEMIEEFTDTIGARTYGVVYYGVDLVEFAEAAHYDHSDLHLDNVSLQQALTDFKWQQPEIYHSLEKGINLVD